MKVEKIVQDGQCAIVDVRTPGEFMGGNVAGSINIPLQEIDERIEELKNLKQPLVLCCASGARSGQACRYLTEQGIECYNGGSWFSVNQYQKQKV